MADAHHPDGALPPHGEPARHPESQHEDRDINVRAVLGFAGALAVVAVVVQVALWGMFVGLRHREDVEKRSRFPLAARRPELPQTEFGSPATGDLPRRPQLEGLDLENPAHDVGRERARGTAAVKNEEEEKGLNNAPIPIEQAMRLVAERSKPQGHAPAAVRYDQGVPDTGGRSNSGRDLPEARR